MGEIALTHQIIGVKGLLEVSMVDANGYSHEHMLRALSDLTVEFEKIGALKGLETEVVVIVVPGIVDVIVKEICVCHDDVKHFF